ncbi:hypothetical protein B0H19DRAFT_1228983 [Mycena capillaripes]|nr:hypothetical protein B0H19DRAFT_1228983 [Mycena capillaripes]
MTSGSTVNLLKMQTRTLYVPPPIRADCYLLGAGDRIQSQKRPRGRDAKKNLNKSSSSKTNEPRCQGRYLESERSHILREVEGKHESEKQPLKKTNGLAVHKAVNRRCIISVTKAIATDERGFYFAAPIIARNPLATQAQFSKEHAYNCKMNLGGRPSVAAPGIRDSDPRHRAETTKEGISRERYNEYVTLHPERRGLSQPGCKTSHGLRTTPGADVRRSKKEGRKSDNIHIAHH